jgi:predicted kinase
MNELTFTVGISGSGKSTWVTKFLKDNPDYLRINYDSIRTMLLPGIYPDEAYYKRADVQIVEKMVARTAQEIAAKAKFVRKNVVIDNTNLKLTYINQWLEDLEPSNFRFKFFDVQPGVAQFRVYSRDFRKGPQTYLSHKTTTLAYIDKQFQQYQTVKKLIEEKWPDKVIT